MKSLNFTRNLKQKRPVKQKNQQNETKDTQPVNVVVNNNNYGESNQQTSTNYKKSLAIYESTKKNPWAGVGPCCTNCRALLRQ